MLNKNKIRKSSSSLYLKDLGGSTSSSFNSSCSQASLTESQSHGSLGCLDSSFGSSSMSSLKELEEYCIRTSVDAKTTTTTTSNENYFLCCSPTSVQTKATIAAVTGGGGGAGDELCAWGHFTDLDEASSSFHDLFLSFQPLPPGSTGLSTLNETEEDDE
jgi:hypothetical protein